MRPATCALVLSLILCLEGALPLRADRLVLVGGGGSGADGVPATQAKLIAPFGVDFDKAGTMFLVELTGERALWVDRRGIQALPGAPGPGRRASR